MKTKTVLKVLVAVVLLAGVLVVALYFLVMKGVIQVNNTGTLYEGHVEIEPISLSELKSKLEKHGCHANGQTDRNATGSYCIYRETEASPLKENGVEIYPHGYGLGPISFYVTKSTLWANKDIPGSPDPEAFKEAVRRDVRNIGNVIKIKENSWKITKMIWSTPGFASYWIVL